ncbi:hypothetical protein MGS_04308 [Candida albicans P78042]|nr:hypothetical protein MG7_04285 [Candida albicans P34048]KGU26908.1 hypothetical protein MGK_04291 [Candida albicans P57055]KHC72963.1 hypothetical protein MGS_04308 [Candida albicans P78042]
MFKRAIVGNVYRIPARSFFGVLKPQSYEISKILHGSPKQVYDIVSQVDQYKTFVPFVEDSFISQRNKDELPTRAGLLVGWKDIVERFECDLICVENKEVTAKSLQLDLFDNLETIWKFHEHGGNKCKVDFKLAFKFKSPIYDKLSSLFAPQVSEIMIGAFEKRLKQIKLNESMKKYQKPKL